jgi:hypothetical protein
MIKINPIKLINKTARESIFVKFRPRGGGEGESGQSEILFPTLFPARRAILKQEMLSTENDF